MISVYDELLSEEDKEKLLDSNENLEFATVVYDQDGQLELILRRGVPVEADVPGM